MKNNRSTIRAARLLAALVATLPAHLAPSWEQATATIKEMAAEMA